MFKQLHFKTMLLLGLMLAGVSSAWAEEKTGSYTFAKAEVSGWTCSPQTTYCGLYYSGKNSDFVVANKNITDFSNVDFSSVTSASVIIKVNGLTNSGTNSYTVSLVDKDGNTIGTPVTKTDGLGKGTSSTSAKESSVTLTPVAGATGYQISCYAKTALAGTGYTLTYTTAGSDPTPGDEPGDDPTPGETGATVSFDLTDDGWGFPADNKASVKTEASYTNNGYTLTINASNGHYMNNGALLMGKSDATLTLPAFDFNVSKIKVYGTSGASGKTTMNIYVGSEPVSSEATSSKLDHEYEIASTKQEAGNVYVFKITNDNNAQITKIEIYGYENVAVGEAGYATYASDNNLDYTSVTGLKAYKAAVSENTVSFSAATEVPAAEGVLLKGDEGTYQVPIIPSAPAITNDFVRGTGAAVASEVDGTYNFILNKVNDVVAFYAANGKVVAKNRAYLQTTTAPTAARLAIVFDDEATTGVTEIVNSKLSNSKYFDLQGRRVAQPTKGLYIVNGKKVIIK